MLQVMKRIILEKDIPGLAHEFVLKLHTLPKTDRAYLVSLSGDLGSGKTTFTKAVAEDLGITDDITSPTFVILKRYTIPDTGSDFLFTNLIHIDAYRLKGYEELKNIKFEEYMSDPQNLILLEWPEMVEEGIKPDVSIQFSHGEIEGERMLQMG
jgi:tRNA threonylcarbamoyladenosine biosynthesis protein TsaE